MENNEKEKKSLTAISDEALEGVSGGLIDLNINTRVTCSYCKKQFVTTHTTTFRGKIVCNGCKAKLESGDAARAL